MTVAVGEKSMDRSTCNFEEGSMDEEDCGDGV